MGLLNHSMVNGSPLGLCGEKDTAVPERRIIAQRNCRMGVGRLEVLIAVGVLCLAAWLILPGVRRARTAAAREQCLSHLGEIANAFEAYLADNSLRWPFVAKLTTVKLHDPPWPILPEVLSAYLGGASEAFHCPADRRVLPPESPLRETFGKTTTWFDTEGTSYEYWMGGAYAGKIVGEESLSSANGFGLGRADQPLLTDFEPFHEGDGDGSFNTLNADLKPRTTRARPEP